MKKVTVDDLMSNMVDYIGDFIENLHKKDQAAIKVIISGVAELQDKLQTLTSELAQADEWTQEDMLELAAVNLLLAASMGIPETVDDNEPNEETPDEETND
jgi:hypothetical protein